MVLYMLSGCRGTGKDTLFRDASSHRLECGEYRVNVVWEVYSLWEPKAAMGLLQPLLYHNGVYERLSFADELKRSVNSRLGLPPDWDDARKDTDRVEGMTIREHWIQEAAEKRAQDVDYYARIVFGKIRGGPVVQVVTDLRYPNEVRPEAITIRLHRPAVSIPDAESEHALDDTLMDILLVPSFNPRPVLYANYRYCGDICARC